MTHVDEWLAQFYPNAFTMIDHTGEIVICLGVDQNGDDCF